jgi:hypothetical protein
LTLSRFGEAAGINVKGRSLIPEENTAACQRHLENIQELFEQTKRRTNSSSPSGSKDGHG